MHCVADEHQLLVGCLQEEGGKHFYRLERGLPRARVLAFSS